MVYGAASYWTTRVTVVLPCSELDIPVMVPAKVPAKCSSRRTEVIRFLGSTGPHGLTVSCTVVVRVSEPEVPVTVMEKSLA